MLAVFPGCRDDHKKITEVLVHSSVIGENGDCETDELLKTQEQIMDKIENTVGIPRADTGYGFVAGPGMVVNGYFSRTFNSGFAPTR